MKKFLKKYIPHRIKVLLINIITEARNYILKCKVVNYLKNKNGHEYLELCKHINKYGLVTFPYEFRLKYNKSMLDGMVYFSDKEQQYYIKYNGVDIFLKKGWDEDKCREYFLSLLIEQDKDSPHCYSNIRYKYGKNDIVVDAGGGRGNFCCYDCF